METGILTLLHEFPCHEYPGDYLLARLQYRRVQVTAGKGAGTEKKSAAWNSDAGIWGWAAEERQWLFRQMNHDLRRATAPVFLSFEIRRMTHALRFIEAGDSEETESLVGQSLLAAGLKKTLLAKMPIEKTVASLETFLHDSPLQVSGLPDIYREKGVQGCEEMIRRSFFARSMHEDLHRDTRSFFSTFITMQNALTMAKCRRWDLESTPPVPHDDGSGPKVSSLPVTEKHLQRMVRRLTRGREIKGEDLHPVSLEPVLDNALLEKLALDRMRGGPVCACIEYLVICHFTAKKRSSALHERHQGRKKPSTMETVH